LKALCSEKRKISGKKKFDSMNLGIFDKFFPSLKTRAQLEERRFDMSRSDRNNDRYVIPMHRKNVWTNKWMQDPRKFFCRLVTVILVRSIGKVGDWLRESED
jgi:hypothetical protein